MREINVSQIEDMLYQAVGETACIYDPEIFSSLKKNAVKESGRAAAAMKMLVENAEIAAKEEIPICQDTGMAIVWIRAGQEVHFIGGSLYEAVQQGIARGYHDHYLRASIVSDPLYDRKNTGTNTPALIYMDLMPGDKVEIELMEKGFGSENKSAVKMLTPADGEKGVVQFVLDTVRTAGPNACPPFIIGVGIGSDFEGCAWLAKKALLRSLDQSNPDPRYADLEHRLLEEINALNIGPMGLHGKTTALSLAIEQAPTHIAGLPVAVNMCCHACRHWHGEV